MASTRFRSPLFLALAVVALALAVTAHETRVALTQDAGNQDPYAAAIAGKDRLDGYFTLYRGDDRTLLELPTSRVSEPWLCMQSIARGLGTGFLVNGMTGSTGIYAFKQLPNGTLQLVRKNVRFVNNSGTPLGRAVDISFADSPIMTVPVVAKTGRNLLLDLGTIFLSDFSGARAWVGRLGASYGLDSQATHFGSVKVFPSNVELRSNLFFKTGGNPDGVPSVPDARGIEVVIHYSLSALPKNGYKPRVADDRIGYFTTTLYDFAQPQSDGVIRYINRWNLEKSDPSRDRSPAKEPVIFWIENTVPYQYRPYIRQALENWNRAFAAAGIQNAIEARQMPDDADWDPEDARYNTIRWTAAYEMGFAIGPSRVNPLTGQILDADILIDANFVRSFGRAYRNRRWDAGAFEYGLTNPLDHAVRAPAVDDERLLTLDEMTGQAAVDLAAELGCDTSRICTCSMMKSQWAATRGIAWRLQVQRRELAGRVTLDDSDLPEDYVGIALRDLVQHEVGHTLGLRHNFKASTLLKLSELKSTTAVEQRGFAGSVMDYLADVIMADPQQQGYYNMPDIGPYDVWAIRYGYTPENDKLPGILGESAKPEHIYGTDEDAGGSFGVDPYCRRWDMSNEPLDHAQEEINLVKRLWKEDWTKVAAKDPEDRVYTRRAFHALMNQHNHANGIAASYIGGVRHYRPHSTDPGAPAPVQPVAREKQEAALEFLLKHCFGAEAFTFDHAVLAQLAPSRWGDWASTQTSTPYYPAAANMLNERVSMMNRIHSGGVIERLAESALIDPNALTAADVFSRVTDTLWTSEKTIAADRRAIQAEHVQMLTRLWENTGYPTEGRTLARVMLRRISNQVKSMLGSVEDVATAAHLEGMAELCRLALEPR